MDPQLVRIAREIKRRRRRMGLRLEELAQRAGVSQSLISKVENSRTIPSMPVLIMIARGLQTTLSDLVSGTEEGDEPRYVVIRSSDHVPREKEDAVGFQYETLISRVLKDSLFEVSILSVEPRGERHMVQSNGSEFVYLLEGTLDYRLGEETISLASGDALFFDGHISHVPVNASDQLVRMLVVYVIDPENSDKSENSGVSPQVSPPSGITPFKHRPEHLRVAERWRQPLLFSETIAAHGAARFRDSLELLGEHVFRGDCHAHSEHSDGIGTIEEIAAMVKSSGLDFQWVTDHWGISQEDECRRHGLWVGQEPDAGLHHLGILSLGQPYTPMGDIIADYARVEAAGGTPFIPHPTGWWPDRIYRQEQLDILWDMPQSFLMEIINGGGNLARAFDHTDVSAVQIWDRLLNDGFHIHAMANTDAHLPHQFGIAWNGVIADTCTEASILAALRAGRFFASEGPVLSFRAGTTEMGDVLGAADRNQPFTLRTADVEGLLMVRVIMDGIVVHTWYPESARRFEYTGAIPEGAQRYLRAEAISSDGCRGFTNPVYLVR